MSQALKKIIQLRDSIDDINDLIEVCSKELEQDGLDFYSYELMHEVKNHLYDAYDCVNNIASNMQDDMYDLRK